MKDIPGRVKNIDTAVFLLFSGRLLFQSLPGFFQALRKQFVNSLIDFFCC